MGKIKTRSRTAVVKTRQNARRAASLSVRGAKKVAGKSVRTVKKVPNTRVYKKTKRVAKKTHHVVATKPHEKLVAKSPRYALWHQWRWHSHTHLAILVIYIGFVGLLIFSATKFVFAADQTDTWTFATPSNFTIDSGIETSGSVARLKAQNYSDDVNTSALFHLDETNGTTANDSSANNNTATTQGSPSFDGGNLNNALSLSGNDQHASAPSTPSLSLSGQHSIEAWTKLQNDFNISSDNQDLGIVDKGDYKLYYDRGNGKIQYEIADSSANSWSRDAGVDTKGSWDQDGKTIVRTMAKSGSNIFVGLGTGVGDAEVWRYDGTNWQQIGGDGKNNSWADQQFENVLALSVNGDALYAGLGNTVGDGEVWTCSVSGGCTSWTKVGGDGLGWGINTFETVTSLTVFNGSLYAGLGQSANDAEVWRYDGGTSWTKVGGDSLNSGWTTNYEEVTAMTADANNLYVGLGLTAGDGEVWKYNGSTWTKIGGDGLNGSMGAEIETVYSMTAFGGNLYAGTGLTAGDADVWKYNGSTWTQIGGDNLNSGWAASTYEYAWSLTHDGNNLYAGLGSSNGDGEVWKFDGMSWSKLGGDGLNSSWSTNQGDGVPALLHDGSKLYAGLYDAGGDGLMYTYDGSWSRTGGGYTNKSWGFYGMGSVESFTVHNSKLYAGTAGVAGAAMVWEYDGSSWRLIGGQGANNSWGPDTHEAVYALQSYKGNLYVGLGYSSNDAEVWKWDGSTWTQVGGDNLNGGWNVNYESVNVLGVFNGKLYAGLGISNGDGELWEYDDTSWTKVGGDGVNGGWGAYEQVLSITTLDDKLYIGLGNSDNDGEVWRWSGSGNWAQVGGDGINSGWTTGINDVYVMRVYNGKLYAGLGSGTGEASVWEFDGTTWVKIGGDDLNNSWTTGTYERVRAMTVYNGELWTGIGDTAGDGEAWKYNGTTWTKMGGNSLKSGWTNVVEMVTAMLPYKGKLYLGTGLTANADNYVWSFGNNAFLASNTSSFNTDWRHIAATYDGSTMKLYINGTLDASTGASVNAPSSGIPLLIGSTYGSGARGEGQGYFKGQLDEIRLSNIARTGFTTKPYLATPQFITLTDAVRKNGIQAWDEFSSNETTNGGSINYRLSDDEGTTWKYWDGSGWATSSNNTQANPVSVINSNISSFPVTFSGIKWQAVMQGDGNQQVTLNSTSLGSNVDSADPDTNASGINAYKSNGGNTISSGAWTNSASPYFNWTAASDTGSGIKGYCLYLGTDNTADPVTTKGLLGNSPVNSGGNCEFLISANNIDLATAGLLANPLTTSNNSYYLRIKAIDNAGNVYPNAESFNFKFDNTPPSNPGFISAPGGFINTKTATFTWPTSGGQEPADANAGLAGLQYRINNTVWYGDAHNGSGDVSDLLVNDGNYTTIDPTDFTNIIEGINTVYFRTWDQAGNVTTNYVSAVLKVNTNGSPSEPQNVSVTPSSNTTNSFAFDWDEPATFVGDANNLSYCYTINAEPTVANCTFTSGGVTSLGAGPYATQPGSNTFYVVAKDESNNINYANYASTTFSANTPSPGIPTNVDIVDVSIKTTNNWRLALTWDPPANTGAGIAAYKVYRSTDNSNFSFVGSSSSTTYIDASLTQQTYYYKIKACDSTNNCGADTAVVSLLPTGKFISPATLTAQPSVSNVTTKKAKVSWSTDRGSDSKIAIGTSSGSYSPSEVGNSDQVTAHSLEIDNLAAGTTYYFKAKWTDEDGNTGTSQEFTFTTSPAPVLKEVTTVATTLSSSLVRFTSKQATKVNIYYGKSESFGGVKSINTSLAESSYSFNLDGLDDGSKYYYKLSTFDQEGNEYGGNIFSFTTPPRPKISNLRFQPVEGEPTSTQQITWQTNVPTSSQLVYGKTASPGIEVNSSELKTEHLMVIKNLEDDSEYYLVAQGRDKDGNLSTSDRQVFRTALDTRSPLVRNINIEVSIKGTGAEARGQVVVSWQTDEPSTSQVAYAEGSDAVVFNNKSTLDEKLTTEHLVITSDLPTSKLYSIKPLSKDKANNEGAGEVQSAIVGKASDSVLTIILSTLQKIFGF